MSHPVFDLLEAAEARVIAAAGKVCSSEVAGHHPTHLGGCIGALSASSCECGLADVRFAVLALDRALTDVTAAGLDLNLECAPVNGGDADG